MKTRREVSRAQAVRYRRARKGKKGEILTEFCALTKYNRSYAAWLLRHCGKRQRVRAGVEMMGIHRSKADRRGRPRLYGLQVVRALAGLWAHFGFLCGKRLKPLLAAVLPLMHRHGELTFAPAVAQRLLAMSPSSIDRLLRPQKRRLRLKGTCHTRSANWLLLQQVPVKTWSEWEQVRGPGHVQMDLVGHDGGNSRGQFAFTLTLTDIWTQWTEREPVANRAQKWVFAALEAIRALLSFALLSMHTDSGSEFINLNLIHYCRLHHIRLTRSRPERKNDNCQRGPVAAGKAKAATGVQPAAPARAQPPDWAAAGSADSDGQRQEDGCPGVPGGKPMIAKLRVDLFMKQRLKLQIDLLLTQQGFAPFSASIWGILEWQPRPAVKLTIIVSITILELL